MTQLPDLTRKVDIGAISARLNRSLQPQGVNAVVVYQANCLKISLESLDVPDQARLSSHVVAIVQELRVPVMRLDLSGYRSGQDAAVWQQTLRRRRGQFVANVQTQLPTLQQNPRSTPPTQKVVKSTDRAVGKSSADLLVAAKRGDLSAIQAVVNAALAKYPGVRSQVELRNGCLKLMLESQGYLGGPAFANELALQLNPLSSARIQRLEIYKRKVAQAAPFLIQTVSLPVERVKIVPEVVPSRKSMRPVCPIGVQLIAWLAAGVGLVNLLIVLAMVVVLIAAMVSATDGLDVSVTLPYVAFILLSSLAVAAGAFVVAIGLRQMKRWSLWLSNLLAGFMLFRGGLMLRDVWGTQTAILNIEIVIVAIAGLMLLYLTQRKISKQFQ
ncbi:hypothetical protein IQ266_00640 [filamentous cyanobacterium LEGE 11480]|uniref:Uncharacterized protein n=1 Tax=Romeriopsis navalis LEGE 11480 TaxID=2777977 RepID=A0A928Z0H0_9CYAN|nr:hypothetical protein [Romeriopsis navalis]MBE9028261.1 hypothetical protein [Romeriopsis navalis LEGE 11480]